MRIYLWGFLIFPFLDFLATKQVQQKGACCACLAVIFCYSDIVFVLSNDKEVIKCGEIIVEFLWGRKFPDFIIFFP